MGTVWGRGFARRRFVPRRSWSASRDVGDAPEVGELVDDDQSVASVGTVTETGVAEG
jgi:hypothetical protein